MSSARNRLILRLDRRWVWDLTNRHSGTGPNCGNPSRGRISARFAILAVVVANLSVAGVGHRGLRYVPDSSNPQLLLSLQTKRKGWSVLEARQFRARLEWEGKQQASPLRRSCSSIPNYRFGRLSVFSSCRNVPGAEWGSKVFLRQPLLCGCRSQSVGTTLWASRKTDALGRGPIRRKRCNIAEVLARTCIY